MSITVSEITKSYGSRTLFEEVTMTFNPGNRYALTGPNGAGKSTFLKIIMGDIEPIKGTVNLPPKVGMLRQNIEDYKDETVVNTVIRGNARLWKAYEEQDRLYEKEEMTDADGMRLGELQEIIAEEDGYSAEAAAEELLTGMGVTDFNKKMHEIPTDMQFRALLAQALFGNPSALLLDEPTNHLDLESIGWLERFLHDFKGTILVVSHDRHFLNAVATHVADIDYETVIIYPGNYDNMLVTKAGVRERSEQEAKSREKKIAALKKFVDRFSAGTRASQVQSRLGQIERLKPDELKKSNIQRPYIRFNRPEKESGKTVCKIEGIYKSYDHPVIQDFSFEIHRGDKIGVIGSNGRGKTTLLKMIAHLLPPDQGEVEYGHQVQMSYFPQNHSEILENQQKVAAFEWLRDKKMGLYDQDIRSVLGKLLFGGEDAFKAISALSGGETARLLLGGMMLEEHNFIVLDEPNNHLDLEAVSALSWGLADYKGTAIVANHDRDLIGHFATKIIALEKEGITCFDGTLEEYLAKKEQG